MGGYTPLMHRHAGAVLFALVCCLGGTGCTSVEDDSDQPSGPVWDLERAEILTWSANDSRFNQDHAVEASGLTDSGRYLYATSEKYWRILQIHHDEEISVRVIGLDVPGRTELEGIGFADGTLFLCDEAHAAVYRVELPDEGGLAAVEPDDRLPVEVLQLEGPDIQAGKIGVEGVAVTADGDRLWLLLERHGNPDTGCVSRIFPLRVGPAELVQVGEPIEIALEDCNWRLTGLDLWRGELLALKTQYPGERYEIISIDPATGRWRLVLEMTDLLRGVREEGWNNNVEGLAVTEDGVLWMVSDNAWTQIIDDPTPVVADEGTLLIRIPPVVPGGGK